MGHDKGHPMDSCDDHTPCSDCTDGDCTPSAHGLMPKVDKIKLDGLSPGGGNCSIAVGTYTGDGSTGLAITGLGFQPKYVQVAPRAVSQLHTEHFFKIDDNWGEYALKHYGAFHSILPNMIISFDADGFTVDDAGADAHPNKNGQVYSYLALG